MVPQLAGKVAVVTGGNQGIGLAIARALAVAGSSVAICARSRSSLEQAAAAIRATGVDCLAVACDVADPGSTDAMASAVLQRFGRVDHAAEDRFWQETYLYSRAASVYGGTRQIQRNIIADRVLALPQQ